MKIEIKAVSFVQGYVGFLRQPSYAFDLILSGEQEMHLALSEILKTVGYQHSSEGVFEHSPVIRQSGVVCQIADFFVYALQSIDSYVFSAVFAHESELKPPNRWVIYVPAISFESQAPVYFLTWLKQVFDVYDPSNELRVEALSRGFKKVQSQAAASLPKGTNIPLLIESANQLGIYWRHRVGTLFQFGIGARSRILDSTITDTTTAIGVKMALQKHFCNRVLGEMGFPVTKVKRVGSLGEAKRVAADFGFPLVLKPTNLDGGLGVHVGIFDNAGLERAFESARKLSQSLLVEQYVEGVDCRLQVFKGEVFWAVLRRSAHIVGDGINTVRRLIELTNQQRLQKLLPINVDFTQERSPKQIVLADETLAWLARQGLDFDSVPALGQEVRLRGAANVSLGGSFKPVLNEVHPDNIALAKRVGQVLGLDLYGVDLLIPDFRRSWREQECAICEVNAQPEVSRGAHAHLLQKLLDQRGRVPVIMSLGDAFDQFWSDLMVFMKSRGLRLGWANQAEGRIGEWSMRGRGYFNHVQMLLSDKQTDVVGISSPLEWMPHKNWPVNQVDILVLLDAQEKKLTESQIEWYLNRVKQIWIISDKNTPLISMAKHPERVRVVSEKDFGTEIVNKIEALYRSNE
jgi:D-alanine-D-alanine ligase-like ATP-grasp enzyme